VLRLGVKLALNPDPFALVLTNDVHSIIRLSAPRVLLGVRILPDFPPEFQT
jgi:hypothetical protein